MPAIPDWNVIRELYNKGMPLKEIAKLTGVQQSTIASRACRGNWKRTAAKADAIAQSVSIQVQGQSDESPQLSKQSQAVRTGLADVLARSVEKIQALSFKTPKAALKANQELESVVRNAKTVFGWSEGQSQPSVRISVMANAVTIEEQGKVIDVTSTPVLLHQDSESSVSDTKPQ